VQYYNIDQLFYDMINDDYDDGYYHYRVYRYAWCSKRNYCCFFINRTTHYTYQYKSVIKYIKLIDMNTDKTKTIPGHIVTHWRATHRWVPTSFETKADRMVSVEI